jgi:hypothetical protein
VHPAYIHTVLALAQHPAAQSQARQVANFVVGLAVIAVAVFLIIALARRRRG